MLEYTNNEDEVIDEEVDQAAKLLKKRQVKIRKRFAFLGNVSDKEFPAEYVRIQAQEICNLVKDLAISPLNSLYNELYSYFTKGDVMYKFCLSLNDYGELEPDADRIITYILPDAIVKEDDEVD